MRQKVKRYSRSALSILLTFCMIVSMVAVSQITTFAAEANIKNYSNQANEVYLIGDFNNWAPNDAAWKLTNDDNNHYYGTFTISSNNPAFKLFTDGAYYGIVNGYTFSSSATGEEKDITTDGSNMTISTGTSEARTIIVDLWESYGSKSKLTVQIFEMHLGYGINNNNPQNFTWVSPTASGSNYTYDFSSVLSSMKGKTCYFALSTTNGYAGMYGSNSVTVTGSGSGVSNPGMQDFNVGDTPTYFAKANISSGATSLTVTAANTRKAYTINADASVTVNTTVTPSGVGTANVSNSSNVGTATSVSVDYGSNVYLKATATNSDYEFSSWKAVSGLEYESPGSNTTKAKATADATATAIFLPKKYGITKQNSTHIKVNVPTEARWGSSVTPTATAEPGYKVDKFQWSEDGGSTWEDLTPGSSFTMPKYNVIVKAVETTCATHTVTFSTTTGNGSIRAVTDDGRTITSGGLVNTGSVVTFTAVPADEATFTSWGGALSGSVSPKSLTVNADKDVTATFGDNAYFVASYTNSTYNADSSDYSSIAMTRLNNGYYRSSTTIPDEKFFTVGKTAGSTTTYAKCGQDEPWGISNVTPAVTPQHWTSDAKMQSKYQNKIAASYVFYDPETDKIWLSSDPAGFTGVTIFAKDGSLASPSPGFGTAPGTTCGWGNTTLSVTAGGSNKQVTNVFNDQVHKATLTAAEAQAATTSVTVSTTVSESDYYVYGYDVNGATVKATNGSATFCPADLDCNISNFIEITPIYMLTDSNPNNPTTIRFYVRSFAGEIESSWGGALYCYSYNDSREATNGIWPGQPMVNLGGGTYYMDLPLDTRAITLSNAAADWVHATTMGIALPTDGDNWEPTSWNNRNAYQCQSYDYDDFRYIYAKPGVGENDEDIIFDFKYKQGEWGKSGLDNFPDNQFEKQGYSETNFPNNLAPSNSSYQWEEYTDFYGNPVDLWGTRLTSNYNNNPVRVVVQGYYDTSAANSSYYATTYVVYQPSSTTGNCTYSIVRYTDSTAGYGKKSRSEFLQRSAEDMDLTELAGQPVEITYEYAIYKNRSTKDTHEPGQLNQYAERADGVWYYSETKPVKAKIKIQYADKLYGAYTDDTFEIDTDTPDTDYDGDPYTVNEGTVTKGKAYFIDNNINNNTNRPSGAPFDVTYTNRTVEFAYSDGNEHYELQAEESPDGEYTFVGWYKETSNGLDKCPPGFTYSMEATTNETFIARYVKAPSGIKLAHKPVVTGNSGGNGNRKVKYEIYNNPGLTGNPLKTGEANGSIVVDKKYIKYNQNYYLKVTYEVVPDGNSLPNGIYSTDEQAPEFLISEEGFESHNTYNSKHVDVTGFALTPEGTATTNTTKVEFKVPINAFFKRITGTTDYEFDEDLALLELFSDIDRKRNNINITKTVDYNNSVDKFSFIVKALNDHDTPEDSTDDTLDDYVGKYTVGDDPTEHSFTGTISNVSGNQTIHIVGAPAGTVFQISEVDPATDTAYNFTSVTIDGAIATYDIPKGKQFTMPNNGSVDMKFNNNIKKADVKVKKVVVDGNSGTQKFPITLTYTAPGAATTTKTVNLGHDETTTGTDILTLPVGTTITVSEDLTDISGYAEAYTISGTNISQTGNTFTVTAQPSGTDALITVTNKKLHNVTVTKTTDWNNTADEFTFNVKKGTANYSGTAGTSYKVFNGSNEEQTRTFNADGNITLKKDEYVVIYGVKTGDKFTVHETENARYTLASVTGVVSSDNTEFTIADDNVSLTYLNEIKKNDVTIQKIINNSDDNETEFPLSIKVTKVENDPANQTFELKNGNQKVADISEGTALTTAKIKRSETLTIKDVPIGYTVEVIETDAQTGSFEFDSIEVVNNTAETSTIDANARKALLTTKNTVAQVKITNKPIIRDIEITKSVDNGTGTFYVVVQHGNGYATFYQKKSTDNYGTTQTVGDDHKIAIQPGETIKISGVAKNTQVTVQEVDIDSDFVYVQSTVSGATGTELSGDNHGTEFTMGSENVTVNIQNKEDIKYQFEITYIYESYSAKTYKDNTAHDDDNRVEGANRSYTQTGEISREDLDTYFNKASDGSLSIKSDKRKDFINKFAPYEDDFMLNLVWDDSNPKATYDAPNKTIRLETTATSVTARTVRVKVKMPWSDGAYVAVPESKLYTTQYGDHVYDTDGSFLTAPQTLDNNGTTMYFKYWQIKTDYNEKDTNYSDTNSKRCYYDSFNMTMYQDSYVEAVYDTTETSFNPSAQSYADTENGEARIAFMETSRNQWNNNGDPVTNKLAGDRIYTDFQLTFGYKDILLNTAVESGIKTGFVMEQVALLDEEGGKFVTKTESEYKTRYDGDTAQKTTRENAVKAYIADKSKSTYTDALGAHTFKLNSNIALATLDNKNQCKHSVDMSNKVLRGDNLEEGTLKNYVYRAYTYIQLSDGSIVLSDPVYFTIYDVATINNGTTN